jgi:hypothetical protein
MNYHTSHSSLTLSDRNLLSPLVDLLDCVSYDSKTDTLVVPYPPKFVEAILTNRKDLGVTKVEEFTNPATLSPKPILLAYNLDQYTIEYYKVPYSELALSLEGLWVNVDEVTQPQLDYLENLDSHCLKVDSKKVNLSEYSKLVTCGWVQ